MDFSQAEIDRFKSSFTVADGCWEWTKGLAKNGYGLFNMRRGSRKTFHAHRVSWSFHNNRSIPQGMCICHTCDNRKCVNPAHLYLGTSVDNNTDTIERKRGNRATGMRCSWTKLSDSDVLAILASGENQTVLAAKYGVDQSTISQIKSGKRRSSISGLTA